MLRWLLNVVYLLVIAAASPIVIYRMLLHGKYRSGWGQKLLGLAPRRDTGRPCVWFQAVSVGEVLQLRQIVEPLRAHRPDLEFVVSTTTVTGLAVAREKFPLETVCYFPLDFSWAVRRAIQRLRPTAIVLVELELWPNFILAAQRARVPLVLANGRISEKSFRGYRRIRPLMRRLLAGFDVLAVQSPTYAECLTKLGAPSERISVTGSIKFDGVATDRSNAKTAELRAAFGIAHHESVFIAGSTQHPEEQIALDAWEALRAEFPDLRLVLVPRHKERFEDVARLIEARGLPLVRRSGKSREPAQRDEHRTSNIEHRMSNGEHRDSPSSILHPPSSPPPPVCLLDTLGELGACWGLADVAFVGGSLTRRGGQNMIEPAAYGAALLFGPNTWNFRDVVERLLSEDAARVVTNADELTHAVRTLLLDPHAARQQGDRACALVRSQQGAAERTVQLILDVLPDAGGPVVGSEKRAA